MKSTNNIEISRNSKYKSKEYKSIISTKEDCKF